MKRVWLLRLVPDWRFGRWITAVGLFVTVAALLALAFVIKEGDQRYYGWSVMLFFCLIISYIAPVFHFITRRTEEALDELTPRLLLPPERVSELRRGISEKSTSWVVRNTTVGTALWLLQSWLMAGSSEAMMQIITANASSFVSTVVPLLVWLTMICALGGVVDNARLFGRLSKSLDVDLLDPRSLTPFGRMAVSSTLMVIGAQASFSIMWLESGTDPWTTIPPVIVTTAVLVFLLIGPVWPVHRAIQFAKGEELALLQERINAQRSEDKSDFAALTGLLGYRREILDTTEWPFDLSIMTRFGLYLVIVPLTWIGAALIENLVDLMVA